MASVRPRIKIPNPSYYLKQFQLTPCHFNSASIKNYILVTYLDILTQVEYWFSITSGSFSNYLQIWYLSSQRLLFFLHGYVQHHTPCSTEFLHQMQSTHCDSSTPLIDYVFIIFHWRTSIVVSIFLFNFFKADITDFASTSFFIFLL